MNWRGPLIRFLLYASGNRIGEYLRQIEEYEYASRDKIAELTSSKLRRLLLHAYNNVPYYHDVLHRCGVVTNGQVHLERFTDIPILTKKIIRTENDRLYSKDYRSRKPYENTSGGSTGEPVRFLQDREYDEWNTATKLYFNRILGKDTGDPEIKFWGSDRDIIEGNLTLKDRIKNFLYNRTFFNSYRLGEQDIKELIKLNNKFRPVAYWSYMESAFELAKYLSEHDVEFYPPKIVISTIGPLTEEVKRKIESGMKCKVYNQYGSREVGAVSCQCTEQKGLHVFAWQNYVEILDNRGRPTESGEGEVAVTTLHNYSMPLIRYQLGDVAVSGGYGCSCGRNTLLLSNVMGRTLGYFKKSDGSLAHSHFIVQALFFRDWIKRFQVIQDEIDHILIKVELRENTKPLEEDINDITEKTRLLMGTGCRVDFKFVDNISRSPSGKYVYTVCKLR